MSDPDNSDALLRAAMERAARLRHPRNCPVCFNVLDIGLNMTTPNELPHDGDWALCAYCGVVVRFTNTLAVRVATNEELQVLKTDCPRMFRLLTLACHVLTTKARRAS